MEKYISYVVVFLLLFSNTPIFSQAYQSDFQNPNLSISKRVDDLVSKMTLEEKAGQLMYDSPAIKRLGVPEYNWWNECLHGVARNGKATVFPQAEKQNLSICQSRYVVSIRIWFELYRT